MTYSCLPTWPFILFGIVEPTSLYEGLRTAELLRANHCTLSVYASYDGFTDPYRFFSTQAPAPIIRADYSPQAEALTSQFANILFLLAAMAVICCWTTNKSITRAYLIIVVVADLGHIYGTYRGVGAEYFFDVAQWNDMTWGNIGGSLFLHINRLATLAGIFGKWQDDKIIFMKKRG